MYGGLHVSPTPRGQKPAWAIALKRRREAVVGSQEEMAARAAPPAPDLEAHAAAFQRMLASPMTFEDQRELLRVLRVQVVMGPDGLESIGITLP